jgi:methionine-rich copper-binding protein CopC
MSHAARRRTRSAAASLLLATAVGWLVVAPASAHDALGGTTPAAGSTVTVAPVEVTLTFAEPPTGQGLGVAVTGPDGSSVATGAPTVQVNEVTQRLVPLTRSGTYTVAYRVVSADGHPVSGTFRFVLALPTGSSAGPTATGDPTPGASATPNPSSVAAEVAPTDGSADGVSPWAVAGVVVLAAAVVLGVVAVRRRRP